MCAYIQGCEKKEKKDSKDLRHYFEQTQFQPIATFCPYTEIWKNKETSILK